jgi:hypothetical protein
MICPLCKDDVHCINLCAPKMDLFNEPTEACYNCRKKYDLQVIDYPIYKNKEFKRKELP